jgi:hypothetical protein
MRKQRYLVLGLLSAMLLISGGAVAHGKKEQGNAASGQASQVDQGKGKGGACSSTATTLRQACIADLAVSFGEASAKCLNTTDASAKKDCYDTARKDQADARDECGAVYDERQTLCSALGQAAYEPKFGPDFADNFVNPLDIGGAVLPNQYLPLIPGTKRVFKDSSGTSPQTITVTTTHDTKLIDGIRCLVVTDVVTEGGAKVEDTKDWFAQDLQGNVWYCGESSQQLSSFTGDHPATPELVSIDGSWKAGVNGAKAGIVMAADPKVGQTRRLDLSWGEAEDANEILSVNASETTPGAACTNTCLETRDFSPLDAGGGQEHKFYAPGIGVILEVDLETGVRTELQP